MPVVYWFYRSFANSFTLCLSVSLVFQALLTVSCLFSRPRQVGGGLTADREKNNRCFTPADPSARTLQVRDKKGVADSRKPTAGSDARSASQAV